eukprot:scaffold114715_cov63-Phaeocystis_antarctica.AAC.4
MVDGRGRDMLDPSLQTTPLGGCKAVVGVVHVVRLVVGRAALGLRGVVRASTASGGAVLPVKEGPPFLAHEQNPCASAQCSDTVQDVPVARRAGLQLRLMTRRGRPDWDAAAFLVAGSRAERVPAWVPSGQQPEQATTSNEQRVGYLPPARQNKTCGARPCSGCSRAK